jgi:competence protein ComEA
MPSDDTFPASRPVGRIFESSPPPEVLGEGRGGAGDPPGEPWSGEPWPGDWGADLGGPPLAGPPAGGVRRLLAGAGDPGLTWSGPQARWAVPAAAAAAVALVALLVVGMVLLPVMRGSSGGAVAPGPEGSGPTAQSVAQSVAQALPTAAAPAVGLAAATPSPSAPAEGYRVYVVGQVRRPGVVSLPAGSRVEDALDAAGGATSGADLTVINLARKLVDGEQITVVKPGEKPPAPEADPSADRGSGAADSGAAGAGGAATASDPVDLNTATTAEFDTLPGIGPVMAARIVAWRQENGGFKTVDDLNEISGVGDATMAKLRPLVKV